MRMILSVMKRQVALVGLMDALDHVMTKVSFLLIMTGLSFQLSFSMFFFFEVFGIEDSLRSAFLAGLTAGVAMLAVPKNNYLREPQRRHVFIAALCSILSSFVMFFGSTLLYMAFESKVSWQIYAGAWVFYAGVIILCWGLVLVLLDVLKLLWEATLDFFVK